MALTKARLLKHDFPAHGNRVWKKSRKGPKKTFSRLFPDSRGAPGPPAPGDFFQTFSGFQAQRARETPVNGQRVPNTNLTGNSLRFLRIDSRESP